MHFIGGRRKASGTVTRTLVNGGAAAVCALVLAVSACASPPDSATPDATPTASAPPTGGVDVGDDAELFRAAEDTYRAYVDALNRVDLSDPSTFEPVYAWLSGDALEGERTSLDDLNRAKWRVVGDSTIDAFFPEVHRKVGITALACLNVSAVQLFTARGQRARVDTRPDVYALRLGFSKSRESPTGYAISSSFAVEDARC